MLRCIKGNECQTSVCGPGAGGGSRRFIASSGHVLYVSYLHRSFNHTHEPPDVPMRCFFGSSYALVTVCLHINQFVWCMHTTRMRIGMHHTFLTWNELIPMLLDLTQAFLADTERTTLMSALLTNLSVVTYLVRLRHYHWPSFRFILFIPTTFFSFNSVSATLLTMASEKLLAFNMASWLKSSALLYTDKTFPRLRSGSFFARPHFTNFECAKENCSPLSFSLDSHLQQAWAGHDINTNSSSLKTDFSWSFHCDSHV